MSLETRGYRPVPEERNELARYIYTRLAWLLRDAVPYVVHELFWGVPCGPTMSMAHPPVLRGILTTSAHTPDQESLE